MGKVKAIVNVLVFPRSDIKSKAITFFMPTTMTTIDGDVDGDVIYEGAASELPVVPMSSTRSEKLWTWWDEGNYNYKDEKEKGIFVDTLPKAGNINDPLLMLYTERDIGRDINGHNGQLAGVTRMRRYRKRRISADVNSIYAFRGKEG